MEQMRYRTLLHLIGAFLLLTAADSHAQLAVVVNRSVPADSLTKAALLDIYQMNTRRWPDGTPVTIVIQKGNQSHAAEFYGYLGKRPLDLKKIWMRVQLSGEGMAPRVVGSAEDVLAEVAATPGAIAIVRKDATNKKVKAIHVVQ